MKSLDMTATAGALIGIPHSMGNHRQLDKPPVRQRSRTKEQCVEGIAECSLCHREEDWPANGDGTSLRRHEDAMGNKIGDRHTELNHE